MICEFVILLYEIDKKIKANTLDRNLRIYEKIISSGKELDSRQEYYYAKELFYNNKIDKAIERLINVINSSISSS